MYYKQFNYVLGNPKFMGEPQREYFNELANFLNEVVMNVKIEIGKMRC